MFSHHFKTAEGVFNIRSSTVLCLEKVSANRTYRRIYGKAVTGIGMLIWMMPLDMVVGMKRRNHQARTEKHKQKRAKESVDVRTLHLA